MHALLFRLIAEAQSRRYAVRRHSNGAGNSNSTCLLLHTKAYTCNNDEIELTSTNNNYNNAAMCSICLAEFEPGDIVATSSSSKRSSSGNRNRSNCNNSCQHMFHEDCIKDWLKRNNSCPLCKMQFADEVRSDTVNSAPSRSRMNRHHRRSNNNEDDDLQRRQPLDLDIDDGGDDDVDVDFDSLDSSTSLDQQSLSDRMMQLEFEHEIRELTLSLGTGDNGSVAANISTWMRYLMGPILAASNSGEDRDASGIGSLDAYGETTFQNVRIDLDAEEDVEVGTGKKCTNTGTGCSNNDENDDLRVSRTSIATPSRSSLWGEEKCQFGDDDPDDDDDVV